MTIKDYDDFYEEVIVKCIKDICDYHSLRYPDIPALQLKENRKKEIFQFYQKKRDFIKYNYMAKTNLVALDRHKVASCMVFAILKACPFKINRFISDLPEEILLANEYLAFFVALNIIEMYKLDDLKVEEGFQIIIPQTYHEKEDSANTYESNLCKAWYYIRIDDIEKFDVFAYANIFFLLQKYTEVFEKLYKG